MFILKRNTTEKILFEYLKPFFSFPQLKVIGTCSSGALRRLTHRVFRSHLNHSIHTAITPNSVNQFRTHE
jgi:hypothetical protein